MYTLIVGRDHVEILRLGVETTRLQHIHKVVSRETTQEITLLFTQCFCTNIEGSTLFLK